MQLQVPATLKDGLRASIVTSLEMSKRFTKVGFSKIGKSNSQGWLKILVRKPFPISLIKLSLSLINICIKKGTNHN